MKDSRNDIAGLTDEERASALEMVASATVRDDMRRLKAFQEKETLSPAEYAEFLQAANRLLPPPPPRGCIRGDRFLL